MSPAENVSQVSQAATDDTPHPDGAGPDAGSPPGAAVARSSPLRDWSLILGAGLVAGLIGFGIGEAAPSLTPIDLKLPPDIQASVPKRTMELKRRQRVSMDRAAAVAYGGLGMFLGLALGVAGGMARRSPAAALAAGLTGLVLGGAAGAGATLSVLPSYHAALAAKSDADKENNLSVSLLAHGGIWIAVGGAAGLALGLGLGGPGRIARATIGGILGATLAAAIYEFAGAIVFPTGETFRQMAVAPGPRLLAHLSVALCVAVAALGVANYVTLRRAAESPAGSAH
jgi:hypothetical protein